MKKRKRRKNKTQLSSTDYLQPEQIRFIEEFLLKWDAGGGYRAAVNLFLFQFLLMTGLRRCEAAGIEMRDLPMRHGKDIIDVRWQVAKNGRARGIVLDDTMVEIIRDFAERFRKGAPPHSPLLINEYGRRMTAESIYSRIKTIGRRTGLEWLHPHALRHTYGSLCGDKFFLKAQLGHVSLDTTEIYAHIANIEIKNKVSAISRQITIRK